MFALRVTWGTILANCTRIFGDVAGSRRWHDHASLFYQHLRPLDTSILGFAGEASIQTNARTTTPMHSVAGRKSVVCVQFVSLVGVRLALQL